MTKSTEEWIKVGDLTVDHQVQRALLDNGRVEKMVNSFNRDALGIVTVSHRADESKVIIDGWHRWEAVRRVTENQGEIFCRVFKGLTLQEEAGMFLDLNTTNQPKLFDRWRVRVVRGDGDAVEITEILRSYGWTVSNQVGEARIVAISALERTHALSKKLEADPGLVQATILTVTRAWGHDRYAVMAAVFEGIARLIGEHKDKINLGDLSTVLKNYKNGAQGLAIDARIMAGVRSIRLPNAVAELVTDHYNKGKKTNTLPQWRRRQ